MHLVFYIIYRHIISGNITFYIYLCDNNCYPKNVRDHSQMNRVVHGRRPSVDESES